MEATVLSVGKSVLNGALDYAKSTLAEEVALQLGVQRDQAFIRDELEMMQSFLMAAHDDQPNDRVVKTWVKQVRDVAYDVEDCLQDFAVRLGKKKKKKLLSCWRCAATVRTLWARRRIAKEMKSLRGKVEDVSKRNKRYQLIKGSSADGSMAATAAAADAVVAAPGGSAGARATMSGAHEAQRQQDMAKAHLVRLVVSKKAQELRVIAVGATNNSGDDAMKKTTTSIIRRAYDDLKRKNKFECCALVDLTRPVDRIELMQNIVRQLYVRSLQEATGEATPAAGCQALRRMATMKELDQLVVAFGKYLSDKCYLIVLNDLSTIEEWGQIKMCFPENKKGSRIIVSARQVEVASLCAGTDEEEAPEHLQLFADRTLYAFHHKGGEDGTNSMEPSSSSNGATSNGNDSGEMESNLPHTETMVAAFKDSKLIGREDDKQRIIELISKGTQQLEKISVWGMGGIGKTALLQDVYRSEKVKGMFEKVACVTIMRPFNPEDLRMSLEQQLEDQNISKKSEPLLPDILEGKKYLIILDDVLSTTEWDAIESYFPATETGSRIIVTTRYRNVAERCSGDQEEKRYKLGVLGEKDAKDLFVRKAFKESIDLDKQHPELVEEANIILRKCAGLPLAIVTIGGFLASQLKTALEWRKLNEHISAELEMNPQLETIRTVLDISYDGLPYHLKSCFLYLSIFPEDHKISRKRLVRRWTAEGYSREVCDKSAEEIADSYFSELIDRSMILPTQKSTLRQYKESDSHQIHDLIRDIAISKSKEENLVLRLDGGRGLHSQGIVRHLAITNDSWEEDEGESENTIDMSRIRSLTVFGEWRPFFISAKMKLLRVLDLEDTEGVGDNEIKQIGKILHLKYLSLRGCELISCLPDSLGNLRQLETLDIRGTKILKLPKTITNLQRLNYLRSNRVDGINYESVAKDLPELMRTRLCVLTVALLHLCSFVCDEDMMDNINYECSMLPSIAMRLDEHGVIAPRGLRRLKSLRTLGIVNVAWERKAVLEDIKGLTQLRKLGVSGVSKRNSHEFCSALAALSRLHTLSVLLDDGEPGLDGDDGFSPPKNLRCLKLHGNLVALPKWIQRLNNLVKLKLDVTKLKDRDASLHVLGELPNLAILELLFMSFEGSEGLHFEVGSFGRLVVLQIDLYDIKYVKFEQGAAHKLELLLLTGFVNEGEDKFHGLELLPNIRELQISLSGSPKAKERLMKDLQVNLSENPKKPILKVI